MAGFLKKLLDEEPRGYLLKSTIIREHNATYVPITWTRIAQFNYYFEVKGNYPPWAPSKKVTFIVPLKSPDENIKEVESIISSIIKEKIDKD